MFLSVKTIPASIATSGTENKIIGKIGTKEILLQRFGRAGSGQSVEADIFEFNPLLGNFGK